MYCTFITAACIRKRKMRMSKSNGKSHWSNSIYATQVLVSRLTVKQEPFLSIVLLVFSFLLRLSPSKRSLTTIIIIPPSIFIAIRPFHWSHWLQDDFKLLWYRAVANIIPPTTLSRFIFRLSQRGARCCPFNERHQTKPNEWMSESACFCLPFVPPCNFLWMFCCLSLNLSTLLYVKVNNTHKWHLYKYVLNESQQNQRRQTCTQKNEVGGLAKKEMGKTRRCSPL